MGGVFACPECGQEIEVADLSAGLEIQCVGCLTWVEVPYFPRGSGWKRARRLTRQSPWASKALRGAIVLAVVALSGLAASRVIGGRVRSDRERVLAELVAAADQAESSRRYDEAAREIEGAVAHARTFMAEGSDRLAELMSRRDRVSVRDAELRLAALDSLNPDKAVGESLTLSQKARHDRALAPLADAIATKLAESRLRQAEADLALARNLYDAGRDAETIIVAERLYDRVGHLAESDARRFHDDAQGVLEASIARSGVALPPVPGRFVAGSAEAYTTVLERHRAESLRVHGYVPQPRRPPGPSSGTRKPRSARQSRSRRARRSSTSSRRTGRPRLTPPSNSSTTAGSSGRPGWSPGPASRSPTSPPTSPATSPPPERRPRRRAPAPRRRPGPFHRAGRQEPPRPPHPRCRGADALNENHGSPLSDCR